MGSENETVAEVCAKLKEVANGQNVSNDGLVIEISQEEIWDALDRIEAAHQREVAELRECLKEAIREKCPFTRMSCKHGEPCDYECGTFKWRKALQDEGGAK